MLDDVLGKLRHVLEARSEVLESYLFGSLATGTAAAHSDVDVAVYVEPDALSSTTFGYDAELGSELQRALGRSDVDLTVLNTAGPVLYHQVLRDGVRISSRDLRATTTREGRALSRYCDFLPTLRELDRLHRARIASGRAGR
jgi:predicted nucleotidyltransferase